MPGPTHLDLHDLARRARDDARARGQALWEPANLVRAAYETLSTEQRRALRAHLKALPRTRLEARHEQASPLPSFEAARLLRMLAASDPATSSDLVRLVGSLAARTSTPGTSDAGPTLPRHDRRDAVAEALRREIVGQDEAVQAIASALSMGRSGLRSPESCAGVLLFAGPPGTGKTHAATVLARILRGSDSGLVRIDLSEYSEQHTKSRLVGSPPGYVGYDRGGELTEALIDDPSAVVLLDEIEKAHPEVLSLFLQAFCGPHLTDARGRRVSCRQALFVLTTNLGCASVAEPVGFRARSSTSLASWERVRLLLHRHFTAEFLDRVDVLVPFRPLPRGAIRQIVELEVHRLRRAAERLYPVTVTVDEAVLEGLVAQCLGGDQPGARGVRRAVERVVGWPLAPVLGEASGACDVRVSTTGVSCAPH